MFGVSFLAGKTFWRALALLVAAVLIQSPFAGSLEASRDSADCVQTCNSVRDGCRTECDADCADLYPPGEDRDLCIDGCRAVCIDEMQECKAKCNVKKFPHPVEP